MIADNGSKWTFFFLGWLGMVLYFTQRWIFGPVIPALIKEVQINKTVVGTIGSASILGYMLTSILAGWLSDRFGRKQAILLALEAKNPTSQGLFILLAGFIGSGVMGALWTSTGLIFADFKGLALGIITTMGYALATMAPVLIGYIADHHSVGLGLWVVCVPTAFLAAMAFLSSNLIRSSSDKV